MTTTFSICQTCGVEHAHPLPDVCAICADERQYLPADGKQYWTTLDDLQQDHAITITEMEPNLYAIQAEPSVGIGHRSILVQTENGNLLWDPLGYIDQNAIDSIKALGGIRWIAASHPHMYGVQLAWSEAFDNATVLISARDQQWLARTGDAVQVWDDVLELSPDLKLIRTGGHFAGSGVVHWAGADGNGVLLSSDSLFPVPQRGWVTFLRSYPNRIPLSPAVVRRVADTVLTYNFDRLHGNFPDYPIMADAMESVRQSADRQIAWTSGDLDADA